MWICFWGSGHSPCGARRYLSYDRSSGATIDRTIDRLWLPLVVRSSTIVVDHATTRTTNRTMTYHQQERPIAECDPNSNQSYDQQIVRSGVTVALTSSYCITVMCFINRLSIPLLVIGMTLLIIIFNTYFSSTC